MISWAVLILLAKVLNALSGLLDVGRRDGGVCQYQQSLLVPWLFVEDGQGRVPRLLKPAQREVAQAKIALHFEIVGIEFGGFLQQRIGLRQLPLVVIDDSQLPHRDPIVRRRRKHLPVILLGLVVLFGGELLLGARQELVRGRLRLRAAGARNRNEAKGKERSSPPWGVARGSGSGARLC
jgi:hypothetical protein